MLLSILLSCLGAETSKSNETLVETEYITEYCTGIDQQSDVNQSIDQQCATLKDHQICDFDAIDENGNTVILSDYYGQPIVLDVSAMWCGPCIIAAGEMQSKADQVPGVQFITILIENTQGEPPSGEDIKKWISDYGIITEPVWGSSRSIISSDPTDMKNHLFLAGWPSFYFINSDGKLVEYVRGYNSETILEKARSLN
jgi:thiol-disulfide isomerase/thioredoxin